MFAVLFSLPQGWGAMNTRELSLPTEFRIKKRGFATL